MLIRQINQKNVCFVIIGISYIKRLVKGLCDDCYNFSEKSIDFKNIAIVHIKRNAYRIYFLCMSKRKAKKIMTNSNLVDKMKILW